MSSCFKVRVAQLCLCNPMDCSPWNSSGQNTGVGSCSLFHAIFPTQGLKPGLPHCRWILYQLSHRGNPKYIVWKSPIYTSYVNLTKSLCGLLLYLCVFLDTYIYTVSIWFLMWGVHSNWYIFRTILFIDNIEMLNFSLN